MGRDERSTARGDDLEERRERLAEELVRKGVLVKDDKVSKVEGATKTNMGYAIKLSGEFLAGVIVGAALGLGFDQITGLTPWGLVVFLLLGFAAGVLNILREIGTVPSNGAGQTDKGKKPGR